MPTTEDTAIHPLHVAQDLWSIFDPEKALDAEDRSFRADSLAVLLETLKQDRHTIINELERLQQRAADRAENGRRWRELLRKNACCEKAERTPCVCVESWKCPDHGQRCFGSHD